MAAQMVKNNAAKSVILRNYPVVPGEPRQRPPKASDISDVEFLETIDRLSMTEGHYAQPHWVLTFDLYPEFAQFPYKVVLAKARQLINRKLLSGCGCGCRGDFELNDASREFLAEHRKL